MKKLLSKIAKIQSGYHFKEKIVNDKTGSIKFIQFKDIDNHNRINSVDLLKISLSNLKQTHLLNFGDVLIKCRGNNQTSSIFDLPDKNIIASSHFFVIKNLDTNIVLPDYLAWFLNDDATQKVIKTRIGGTHMKVLSKKYLENLEIELPTIDIQKAVVNLHKLSLTEENIMQKINELKSKIISLKLRELLKRR